MSSIAMPRYLTSRLRRLLRTMAAASLARRAQRLAAGALVVMGA